MIQKSKTRCGENNVYLRCVITISNYMINTKMLKIKVTFSVTPSTPHNSSIQDWVRTQKHTFILTRTSKIIPLF